MAELTNETIIREFNVINGISEEERKSATDLFLESAQNSVRNLILKSIASMNQDVQPEWVSLKPKRPEIVNEPIPQDSDRHVQIAGIGGMAAYLNVILHAANHGGKHAVITNPHDIFTYAAWTLHPEEDMDQRLVPMFRTPSLIVNEFKRMLGISAPAQAIRFKAFKVDYTSSLSMLLRNPREFAKFIKVNFRYVLGELTQVAEHYALINLQRNRTTLKAFEDLDRIGNRPCHDFLNMPGRVVFEIIDEPSFYLKKQLQSQYGLEGKSLQTENLKEIYGEKLSIIEDIDSGMVRPVQYSGGYFLAGFKENALKLAKEMGALVYENATVTRISVDERAGRCAIFVKTDEEEKTVIADTVITAVGDYGEDIIPVDGVSTLFVIRTESQGYNLFPTGMGEGGTIHIVPVEVLKREENGKTKYYHLGKATNGAIVGRDPRNPKRLRKDRDFILHIETNLKKILPPDGTLIWLSATECGRPVVASQSYRVDSLSIEPLVIAIAGGCGLGGNTPIIPEVQTALEKRLRIFPAAP